MDGILFLVFGMSDLLSGFGGLFVSEGIEEDDAQTYDSYKEAENSQIAVVLFYFRE